MAMLEINDLTREFTRRGARFAAVDHVSFSMDQGELVAIIGRSGNGKSTLLNLIAGLLKPTSGTVEIDGRNVSKLSDKELSQLRNVADETAAVLIVTHDGDTLPYADRVYAMDAGRLTPAGGA